MKFFGNKMIKSNGSYSLLGKNYFLFYFSSKIQY